MRNPKIWMAQVRANFLILTVFLVLLGFALSLKYPGTEGFDWLRAVLVMIGAVSAHISVNLFNEYSDYWTKIDFKTQRTPFSGGSGMLTSGKSKPREVLVAAIFSLLFSLIIGIYLTIVSHWSILVFAIIGCFSIIFYTSTLARIMLGELFAGLALGTFIVLGAYIAMVATPGVPWRHILPQEVVLLSIPPGILTALLLLINEFPDMEADMEGGRNHLVIRLGKKYAAWLYTGGMIITFLIIFFLPLLNIASYWIYLGLIPLPLAFKASITALRFHDNAQQLIPALGNNVLTVLGVDLLLAVGIFIEVL